jgi:TatD DNase family protein
MFIDTHAHLDFKDFDADRHEVIERALQKGVSVIINVGTDLSATRSVIKIAEEYPECYAGVGIHPHDAKAYDPSCLRELRALCAHKKVVAIGEIGLDYYRDLSPRDKQREMFIDLIGLHKETGLPLIIHARDAYDDIIEILQTHVGHPVCGVMHCFSGDEDVLTRVLALGLHVSFAGQITYKKNDVMRALVTKVPDKHLLLETDCPFLAPQSIRGKRNEPACIPEIAGVIAELRGVTVQDLARYTTLNAQQLFRLPIRHEQAVVVYKIRDSLYINVTDKCSSDCIFCPRFDDKTVKGYDLTLERDPEVADVLREVSAHKGAFKEICFCGLGEPLMRFEFVLDTAKRLKEKDPAIKLRIDTNGQGNLINKKNILPDLKGHIDKICVSLNAHNAETYHAIVKPHFPGDVYREVKDFILEAKKYIPEVEVTCLDFPGVDVAAVKRIAQEELGVAFRLRYYDEVG